MLNVETTCNQAESSQQGDLSESAEMTGLLHTLSAFPLNPTSVPRRV
jgi:hypothetical protein